MAAYVARRLVQSLLILLGISIITFALLYLLPADPARQIAGRSASPEMVASIRHQLGLDQPFYLQYLRYAGRLLHGNLGRSYVQRTDVTALILTRLPPTLVLMVGSIATELALGLVMGMTAALKRNTAVDRVLMVISFVGVSAPQFVLGILLLYVFAVRLAWFPIGGYGSLRHLVLPALTLGILGAGWYARMMRSSLLDVLQQDYLRTAHAKGLSGAVVLLRHALPNAILPVIAMIGLDIGTFMSGIVVVESVFGWPGIGQLTWQAIQRVDIPIIMGVTLVSACAIVLGNLLADLIAPAIDPRIKLR
jgi:peptide/nickel transport system permease protein